MQNTNQAVNPVMMENAGTPVNKILVDAREAAGMCGIGLSTWRRHASAGKTPKPVAIGGRTLWRLQELIDWVAAGCPGRGRWEAMGRTV